MHELRVANSRGEHERELLHAEDGHPVCVVVANGVVLARGAHGVGEGAAAGDYENGARAGEELERSDRARERVAEREEGAADF